MPPRLTFQSCAAAAETLAGSDEDAPPPAFRDDFVAAMGQVPSSVAVVTTGASGGHLALTVGTFISVSADPPMVLVSVKRRAPLCEAVLANRAYAVSVLAAGQAEHADRFAGRPRSGRAYDLAAAQWSAPNAGLHPFLDGAVACFGCELEHAQPVATHVLLIGRVTHVRAQRHTPLVYWSRAYAKPAAQSADLG
ncbi:flavin reductase family protein [Ancylobacter sp. VNQ12]|uniref:flavin reductase family protein n=1 Tax=Ancylobacter sp. VNQ12 TaxID=3400920 RepID=UPI003C04E4AD